MNRSDDIGGGLRGMQALCLGSIGVLAETSDLQREAFNVAFAEAGLDWHWSAEVYADLLARSGGADRIAAEAARRGETVDVAALHSRKGALFRARIAEGVALRPGVAETLEQASRADMAVALVTATSRDNVDAILAATGLARAAFDVIVDRTDLTAAKPDPQAYHVALARLGVAPETAVAVEDNPDGCRAARAAGLTVVAFPGANHQAAAFDGASLRQEHLRLPDAGKTD